MTKIDNIIFDIGGVLHGWDVKRLYRKIFKEEQDTDYFLRCVFTRHLHNSLDLGGNWKKAVHDLSARNPDYRKAIEAYHERWTEMTFPVEGAEETVQNMIHGDLNLFVLSNYSRSNFEKTEKIYPLFQHFDKEHIVLSSDIGVRKPDVSAFSSLIDKFNLLPSACLFVDDKLENIRAARSLGLQGHHFTSHSMLQRALQQQYGL